MPAEDLSEGYAGFFGKLPTTGDFVSRGLPAAFVGKWDRWITRHVAPIPPERLPGSGLRFMLSSGGRCVAGMILPGSDSQNRRFPLTVLQILLHEPPRDEIDRWCDSALPVAQAALHGDLDADELAQALDALIRPEGTEAP
ncbi:MAG: type VI secretion system-associated protein TagF, partial [Tabrizicola sp.]|nr:type VI secretion system-associated protein TagF [Tabrizicola sp.]